MCIRDRLEEAGKINLSLQIQLNPNDPTVISVKQVVNQFNDSIADSFQVSKEFIEIAKPILTDEFLKNGLTPSPLMTLGIAALTDMGTSFASAMRDRNKVIDQLIVLNTNSIKAAQQTNFTASGASFENDGKPNRPVRSEPEESKVKVNPEAPRETVKPTIIKPKAAKATKGTRTTKRKTRIVVSSDKKD